ncbi:MAG TPA: GNAT family N-acetyltransferase [Terracidiphilus sp.]|jgi:GNAT superfamily N-acetyltransferase
MTPQTALPNELSSRRFYTRLATPGDLDSIVELINFAFIDENKDMRGNRTDPNEITSYMQMGHFLLFEEEGHILGVIYAEIREEGRGYLALLATDPQIRRRGVGKQLLLDGEQFCRERGCQVVEATVVSFRQDLVDRYLRRGWRVTGQISIDHPSLGGKCDLVVVEKGL